jgi:DNA-binding GntR family transcriptional regulator
VSGARASSAAYGRVAKALREAILSRRYPPGAQLPTEAELALEHRVGRQTVRRAFLDLVAEGMVYRVPGRGTFVAGRDGRYLRQSGSLDDLIGLSNETEVRVVLPLARRIDVGIAGRLRLQSDVVFALTLVRLHESIPFCVSTVWLPPSVAQLLDDVEEVHRIGPLDALTVLSLLEARLDAPVTDAAQSITIGYADADEADALGVLEKTALLRIDRAYSDIHQRPVELAISGFLPDHYSYRVSMRRTSV